MKLYLNIYIPLSYLISMACLVTGAPGWVGSRLINRLVDSGRRVKCLTLPQADTRDLSNLGVEVFRGDVTKPETLSTAVEGVDVVFHCAGVIHPSNPKIFHEVNTWGTRNLLDASVSAGVNCFIYVSSSSAASGYSSPKVQTEEDEPEPYRQYGESKLNAERYVKEVQESHGFRAVILRPSWLYGPGFAGRQLGFVEMIRSGRPVLFGDGRNLRSLCHIDNCVDALLQSEATSGRDCRAYNIADQQPYLLTDLYDLTAGCWDMELNPLRIPLPSYDGIVYDAADRLMQGLRFRHPTLHLAWDWAKNIVCSIEKAGRDIGYRPGKSFRAGIRETVDWLRIEGKIK